MGHVPPASARLEGGQQRGDARGPLSYGAPRIPR